MATRPAVRPNRRGARSRELVLDAAERVMAERGYEAATLAAIVEEAGIPMSSVYHYFGSKDGILLAVMERGADRFFAALPEAAGRRGTAEQHLQTIVAATRAALHEHPDFLRLLVALAVQSPADDSPQVRAVIQRVRARGLDRLRGELARAFRIDADSEQVHRLARFGLAVFDGAFVAEQADGDALADVLDLLPRSLVALQRALR